MATLKKKPTKAARSKTAKPAKTTPKAKAKKPAAKKAVAAKPAARKTVAAKAKPAARKAVVAKTKPTQAKAAPKTKASAKAAAKPPQPSGIPEQLRDAALRVLDERQAEDILTTDLRGRSPMADYAIVATGRSARQLAAIADYLRAAFEKIGVRRVVIDGLPQGDWVLVDAGDLLVHLFRPEVRRYYRIEDVWAATRNKRAEA